jgi:hypothetical protein
MICFTVSGSSVCALRPCHTTPIDSSVRGAGYQTDEREAGSNELEEVRRDLGEAAAALRDRGGLRGHEAPAAEEGVGARGASAGAVVHRAGCVNP